MELERVGTPLEGFLRELEERRQTSTAPSGQPGSGSRRDRQPPSEARIRQTLAESGLKPHEQGLSLATVAPLPHQAHAHAVLVQWASEFHAGIPERRLPAWWVALESLQTGTGKSYLAMALTADLCRMGMRALFLPERRMMELLRESHRGGSEFGATQLRAQWLSAQLLVLDDLGTDRPTLFSASELYGLIEERLRARRPVMVTTNCSGTRLTWLYNHPKDAPEGDESVQGARIVSRIFGGCRSGETWLELSGRDLRMGV
jgi:hypothetical protein